MSSIFVEEDDAITTLKNGKEWKEECNRITSINIKHTTQCASVVVVDIESLCT